MAKYDSPNDLNDFIDFVCKRINNAAERAKIAKGTEAVALIHPLKIKNAGKKTTDNGNYPKDPITSLQEMCVRRFWHPPMYEYVTSNEGVFTVTCRVNNDTEAGSGTKKKEAKRKAASNMFEKLNECFDIDDVK